MLRRSVLSHAKVAVLGAAGGIGQPLSLLLKGSPLISELSLYDIANTVGVAADLSHIPTPAQVKGFGKDDLAKALDGCKVVVIPAGVPRKPGMTRDDLFNVNASIVKNLTAAVATACPKAMICIISNPVNSTVPIAAEVLKKAGVYDPRRLFGVTTLDICRANTFVAGAFGLNPFDINVPVIGGHSGPTIVPLFSQTGLNFTPEQVKALTHRVQFGGDEVVKAKDGAGSATLSMAFAGFQFTESLLKALRGDKGIKECTFTQNNLTEASFFSLKTTLCVDGVASVDQIGPINDFEKELLKACMTELQGNIKKGIEFGSK